MTFCLPLICSGMITRVETEMSVNESFVSSSTYHRQTSNLTAKRINLKAQVFGLSKRIGEQDSCQMLQ